VLPLSGLDAFFLYAETESMHLHVALTAILDPRDAPHDLTVERLRHLVAERLHLVPPFTRRLEDTRFGLDHPVWVPAGPLDLTHHVRHITVPQPGGPEDLGRVCGTIAGLPLDRDRPLWEMWLVDGLHDGNLALVTKIHHACIDGVSGAELITAFFDLDGEATVPIVPLASTEAAPSSPDHAGPPPAGETGAPGEAEALAAAVRARTESLRHLLPLVRRTAAGIGEVRRRRADHAEAGGTPLTAPRLSFNRRLTPERNCAFAHIPLDEVQAVRRNTRSTVNDVVLATCAGALRRHLERRGELPEGPLVVSCPVSTRTDEERGQQNNKVSVLMTCLHTQIADPLERLHAIRRSTTAGKAEHQLLGSSVLGEWAEAADPTLLRWAARLYLRSGLVDHHPPVHNLTVSNVPGPSIPVFLGGARLVRAYPMGPVVEGAGLNITVMSYLDSIDIGFLVCDDAMPDVWDLADAVAPAFAELRAAVATPVAADI
jgi:WS/DGAT/MGAT family acyltransferase